jgi:uncharacterized protein (UPF0332 family)
MKQDAEENLRKAEETLREMEHLMAEGLYKAVSKRSYNAMLSAATAALLNREVQSGTRQTIVSEFNDAFIKTGLLDGKFYQYFRRAFNSRAESDESSFTSVDVRQAQAQLMQVKEFIKACRTLCD